MPRSKIRPEAERLDAHRAAGRGASDANLPATETAAQAPADFEQSRAVRRARQIERLREAVDADDYRPDPGQIAESMLENERT